MSSDREKKRDHNCIIILYILFIIVYVQMQTQRQLPIKGNRQTNFKMTERKEEKKRDAF